MRLSNAMRDAVIDAAVKAIASSTLAVKDGAGKTLVSVPVRFRRSGDAAVMVDAVTADVSATGYPQAWSLLKDGVLMLSGSVGDELDIDAGELLKGGRLVLHSFKVGINL